MKGQLFCFPGPALVLGRPCAAESQCGAFLPFSPSPSLPAKLWFVSEGSLGWEQVLKPSLSGSRPLYQCRDWAHLPPRVNGFAFTPPSHLCLELMAEGFPLLSRKFFEARLVVGREASCPSCRGRWLCFYPLPEDKFIFPGCGNRRVSTSLRLLLW